LNDLAPLAGGGALMAVAYDPDDPGSAQAQTYSLDPAGSFDLWRLGRDGGLAGLAAVATSTGAIFAVVGPYRPGAGPASIGWALIDPTGSIDWWRNYAGPEHGHDAGQAEDGGFVLTAEDGSGTYDVIKTDPWGRLACVVDSSDVAASERGSLAPMVKTPESLLATVGTASVAMVPTTVASTLACASDCTALPGVIGDVRAVRNGVAVDLTWSRDAQATGYDVWWVSAAADIPLARIDSTAVGVVGCSPPQPAPLASCTDGDALTRPETTVYYQVRGACGVGAEGP
jgi:hypothetical protein